MFNEITLEAVPYTIEPAKEISNLELYGLDTIAARNFGNGGTYYNSGRFATLSLDQYYYDEKAGHEMPPLEAVEFYDAATMQTYKKELLLWQFILRESSREPYLIAYEPNDNEKENPVLVRIKPKY